MRRSYVTAGRLACALVCGAACGDDGGGDMNPPQESVSDGTTPLGASFAWSIAPGTGVFGLAGDELADGWKVDYDKLLVTVGSLGLTDVNGSIVEHEHNTVVDLLRSPTGPLAVVMVPSGATQVRFSMPGATPRFSPQAPATVEDVALMATGGYSLYVEGTITRPDGYTCTGIVPRVCTPAPSLRFRWGVTLDLRFEECLDVELAPEEVFEQTMTLSGDRWLRGNFGDEEAPTLRAQWIANADVDRDGEVTLEELGRVDAAEVFTRKLGYNLRNAAPFPIATARDFLEAQVRTLARDAFGGEGCKSSSDL